MQAAVLKASKAAAQTVMWSSSFVKAGSGSWRNVKVVIKDKRQAVDVNPGGGELGEGSVTTSTTTWECDAALKSPNFGTVSWNTKNNTLTAQLQLGGADNERQMIKTVTFKRIPASPHLPDTSKTEKMDAGSVSTPLVSNWLGRWMSGQIKPLAFNPHQDIAQFNSSTITPEKPLFSDEPDSKENVKVVVRFKVASFL
jgi:hypothetical protein